MLLYFQTKQLNNEKNVQYILESKFFTLGDKPITKKQLEWYCKYWWPIQYEFTLGLVVFMGNLAQKIRYSLITQDFEKKNLWKDILKSLAPAIIDEMGMGRDPFGLMHHDLFIHQVCQTTGMSREELLKNPIHLYENGNLANEIAASMSVSNEIGDGLCMMYIVETIAPQLFAVQKKIFLAAGSDISDLKHSSLHEQLEKEHSQESESIEDFFLLLILKKEYREFLVKQKMSINAHIWRLFLDCAYENLKSE